MKGTENVRVKIEFHHEGNFYTYRGKRLNELKSLSSMRERIVSVKNALWKWHVVLTFSYKNVEIWFREYQNVGKALDMMFQKLRKKFRGFKYFWKYEEGTKVYCYVCKKTVAFEFDKEHKKRCIECANFVKGGEQPHFHALFDFENRAIRCKDKNVEKERKKLKGKKMEIDVLGKGWTIVRWSEPEIQKLKLQKLVYPHNWDKMDWNDWFEKRRKRFKGRKSDIEILLGVYLNKKWQNGFVNARKIRNYMDLKKYVIKDFFKYTEAKY